MHVELLYFCRDFSAGIADDRFTTRFNCLHLFVASAARFYYLLLLLASTTYLLPVTINAKVTRAVHICLDGHTKKGDLNEDQDQETASSACIDAGIKYGHGGAA
ncbi:hypothetical protein [Undibacterium sp.]|uniref:hypothetical protein n=1 Tax=Undibacterium sp. TaxID=1914977 RepID=UPI00374D0066